MKSADPICLFALIGLTLAAVSCSGGALQDCAIVAYPHVTPMPQVGDVLDVHDPVIFEQDGRFVLMSTGSGIPIRHSDDLLEWESVGQVFEHLPPWAAESVPGVEFPWAPDLAYFGQRYHLYYSLSTFGNQRSVIALATSPTLNPQDENYAWQDHGPVVESEPDAVDFNAIDPNVAIDTSGYPWLVWGSYWSGIKMRRLDAATGLFSGDDERIYSLAERSGVTAVEAPFIIRHEGFFYLFVSFDICCRGVDSTYKIMVGRATDITGPYVDYAGVSMAQGGGTLVLASYGRIRGPGHNAVLSSNNRHYLVHHFYDAATAGRSRLQIRSLLWDAKGWPLAGEPYDGSDPLANLGDPAIVGSWAHSIDYQPPFKIELFGGGRLASCVRQGSWSSDGTRVTFAWTGSEGSNAATTERVTVAGDGSWYAGRAADGTVIRGLRLNDAVRR